MGWWPPVCLLQSCLDCSITSLAVVIGNQGHRRLEFLAFHCPSGTLYKCGIPVVTARTRRPGPALIVARKKDSHLRNPFNEMTCLAVTMGLCVMARSHEPTPSICPIPPTQRIVLEVCLVQTR
ncbi:hypothetical protein BDV97DRAFT_29360 [Delphinella strobiligena]|nr:hypothetical protein BDV97DRAFT_29360 [Delphinella strobiligena]